MSDETPEKMPPEQGIDALMQLIGRVGEAAENSDTAALDDVMAEIGSVMEATGVDLPEIQDNLTALRGENAKIQRHAEEIDAAMWAGDLERANALAVAGVPLDRAAIPGLGDMDDFDFDAYTEAQDFTDDDAYVEEIDENDPQLIKMLAEMGLGQGEPPEPDIFAEIAAGEPGAIEAAIARGDDLNKPCGPDQHTALLAALDAPGRRAEGIGRLILAGADARALHATGDNALSWAAGYHHPETVTAESEIALMTLLARHGADANHVTRVADWTPLHRAIIQGDTARVAGMLAAGADITATVGLNFEPEKLAGFTPLMLAAPKPDVLRLLLAHGANPAVRDAEGGDPVEVIGAEAKAARARADANDPWSLAHAEALEESAEILARAVRG